MSEKLAYHLSQLRINFNWKKIQRTKLKFIYLITLFVFIFKEKITTSKFILSL